MNLPFRKGPKDKKNYLLVSSVTSQTNTPIYPNTNYTVRTFYNASEN
jgi:hypothetical protein